MATMYPTISAVFLTLEPRRKLPKHRQKYEARSGRVGNHMAIYVTDGFQQHYYKSISLKRRWYHFGSPASRIRVALSKAQAKARELNHQELYIDHEAQIAVRP